MPEYLSPGVYVEEIEIGGKPIEGVSTSTAGFLGPAERGPTGARLITGFAQYQRLYGWYSWKENGKASGSCLPYAVEGFFANGGKRCFVGRVTGKNSQKASGTLKAKTEISFKANGEGSWGNRIGVAIEAASMAKKDETTEKIFKIVVFYWSQDPPEPIVDPRDTKNPKGLKPAVHEEFDNLSWDPASADYYLKRLHGQSHLIEVSEVGTASTAGPAPSPGASPSAEGGATPGSAPAPQSRRAGGSESNSSKIQLLKDGKDSEITLEDYKGNVSDDNPTGLAAFVGEDDISIVCVPNQSDIPGLSDAVVDHCELSKDRFAILQTKEDAGEIADLFPEVYSKYAALYYPRIKIIDPATNMPKLIPPGGHIAGIYARSDIERGVHKAPANEPIRGAIDVQFNVTKGEQDILNPRGVNCIRSFTGRGIVVWGARTTSTDPLWKYINVRRLFLFLEKSIERATQWVVFEPNTTRLWARLRQSVSDFLTQVWRDGALMGTTPEQAFFVKCDETTMTPTDIETGKLILVIGVAPAYPAEFVIFQLAIWRSGSSLTE
jgi:Bacteriophage tail sheath protein